MLRPIRFLLLLCACMEASAQGTRADYERANNISQRLRGKVVRFQAPEWLPDGSGVHFRVRDASGKPQRFLVRRDGVRKPAPASALDSMSAKLPARSSWGPSSGSRRQATIRFENRLDRRVRVFWANERGQTQAYGHVDPGSTKTIETFVGHVWVTDFTANDLTGIFIAESGRSLAVIDGNSRKTAMAPKRPKRRERPKRRHSVTIRDHDVFGRVGGGDWFPLTQDGTAEHGYDRPRWWSPDGRYVLGLRRTRVETRRIPLVDSTPDDQVQPKIDWLTYRKPGDPMPELSVHLFDLQTRRAVPVDTTSFRDAYSINRVWWAPDSSRVYCVFNQRGHQLLALRGIDPKTGKIADVIREESPTFVDYSQKTFLHWIADAPEVLWTSERDGWNHLYRFDRRTGKLINQVTRGPWVVRKIERVDEEKRQVWFTAMGIHPEQDPYHRHLARVDFDGRNLTVLTRGDGTHEWEFSPDGTLLLTRWSRVDQPTVHELRDAIDGSLIAELGRDDASGLEAAGIPLPERFTAMGRDAKTPIFGFILRPSTFDPKRRYPVLEHIYAGPHGHHVPKAFSTMSRLRKMAELGFIVVKIDGMGTNWRSKAFHDVCWRNLKDGGFPDRIAWMRAAARTRPEMDLTRVGVYGGSAGGQNALAALLHHGDFYGAAAADCGCHDNRMDKIWWNEAWMGRMGPHYEASSNVTHAHRLSGRLLLTVGELDRNVDPASTMQVVDALIRANKDFDLIVGPGAGHGVGESPYMFRRRQDFFVRALMNAEPRR